MAAEVKSMFEVISAARALHTDSCKCPGDRETPFRARACTTATSRQPRSSIPSGWIYGRDVGFASRRSGEKEAHALSSTTALTSRASARAAHAQENNGAHHAP
jgi:hypothetical protein